MNDTGPTVVWRSDDEVLVGETPYVLMDRVADADGEMHLYKPRIMLECFEQVITEFQGANILEIGILDGGSTAYFAQRCRPRRLVSLERSEEPVERLDRFLDALDLRDRVSLHYGVDQADRARLRSIAIEEFGDDGIDLVIDDASHRYDPTIASFETLFPFVRPGGLYLIEDWSSDDWLSMSFADIVRHLEPLPRAVCEQWLVRALEHPDDLVAQTFDRWILRALTDPAHPDHDAAEHWCTGLRRAGAGPDAAVIDERVRARLARGAEGLDAPTLGTLGLELLLAVKGLCSSIASVTVTPWWIAVRRGGPIAPVPFTVASIARDRLGTAAAFVNRLPGPGAAAVSPPP